MFIQNWWGIWPRFMTGNIFYFFYSLIPIALFYIISVIIFPETKKADTMDMKFYFYNSTRWFFLLLAIYFSLSIVNSFVYPDIGNVLMQNIIRSAGVVLACFAAYFNRSKVPTYNFLVIGYALLIQFFIALPN